MLEKIYINEGNLLNTHAFLMCPFGAGAPANNVSIRGWCSGEQSFFHLSKAERMLPDHLSSRTHDLLAPLDSV